MEGCIFCKIINGEIPSYKIWENDKYLAILDIFPQARGMTVVMPKKHFDSYLVRTDENTTNEIINAAKEVARLLDSKLPKILRTAFVIEGLDVDHLHIKLIPYYKNSRPNLNPGRATNEELEEVATLLRS